MVSAYYNEIDPFKAEVIREAIKAGAIAPGDVDERSIADVKPADLVGYTQCHFFAGGGFWSLALRQAGWPDDRPVWTGSCPCPSFSEAGKGEGFDDDRHLWPVWDTLIGQCRPPVLFGEQSHAAIGFGWLDLVCGNLEAKGYAVAAAVLGAHSVGAPHRRQRLYFCADAESRRLEQLKVASRKMPSLLTEAPGEGKCVQPTGGYSSSVIAGDRTHADGRESCDRDVQRGGEQRLFAQDCGTGIGSDAERDGGRADLAQRGSQRRTADGRDCATDDGGHAAQRGLGMRGSAPGDTGHAALADEAGGGDDAFQSRLEGHFGNVREWRGPGWLDPHTARSVAVAGATRGFWADCDWWYGRDEKYRPIGPGLQPLAAGSAARVGRLRMYGDAIVVPQAKAFIESYLDC